jgi:TolA-binding protein
LHPALLLEARFYRTWSNFTDNLRDYNTAVDLYQEDQYVAAQRLFEKVIDKVEDETIKRKCSLLCS